LYNQEEVRRPFDSGTGVLEKPMRPRKYPRGWKNPTKKNEGVNQARERAAWKKKKGYGRAVSVRNSKKSGT